MMGCDPLPVTGLAIDGSGYTVQITPASVGANFYVWNSAGIQVFDNFTGTITDPDNLTETFPASSIWPPAGTDLPPAFVHVRIRQLCSTPCSTPSPG
jgi:hypothetical protein